MLFRSTALGGVQPAAKTDAMTQAVGVDADGALWTEPGSGGGSGGGASHAFSFYTELTEDVQEVLYTLPVVLDKIYVMNIHVSTPVLESDVDLRAHIGGGATGYFGFGTLASAAKAGADLYLVRSMKDMFAYAASTAKNYPENAKPGTPNGVKSVKTDTNTISIYSNVNGVNIPVGTQIHIWGVCA